MHKFELEGGKFHSYDNKYISSDRPWSLLNRNEEDELRLLAHHLIQRDHKRKPKLSFYFKLIRFFTHLKWSDKHFRSGNGEINDALIFNDEITHLLTKLTKVTYLSSGEIRQLLTAGIREYRKDSWYNGASIPHENLKRCKNLQEFYSNEKKVNFDFAESLYNLRVVDLFLNQGNYNLDEKIEREVQNIDKLQSCLVLHLMDSYVEDFRKIPIDIWTLSVRNSNFDNLQSITHLKNLEYLDISYTKIIAAEGLSELKNLRVLNLCYTVFTKQQEILILYREILKLDKLEVLLIDKQNSITILRANDLDDRLKDIIVIPNSYNDGFLDSSELVEILKIPERLKDQTYKLEVDYKGVKNYFSEKFIK